MVFGRAKLWEAETVSGEDQVALLGWTTAGEK